VTEHLRFLPQTVNIAGYVYSINYVHEWSTSDRAGLRPDDEPWGRTRHAECVIEIWDQLGPQQQIATLLHEIIHCCEYVTDVHLKERAVSRIANVLHGVLLQNQEIVRLYTR
jgi:hypothetical protein